jgi:predicted dienelactone hydrolase
VAPARARLGAIVVALATAMLAAACGGAPNHVTGTAAPSPRSAARPAASSLSRAASAAPVRAAALGTAGTYRVGERRMTFTEPAHTGVTGQHLGERSVLTLIRYPVSRSGSWPAGGPFPLLMFAPGFQQCSDTYEHLLQSWASAGYVVAAVDFPRTDCLVGSAAYEPDLVNQPGDVSYVLSRLLALNAQPGGFLSGRLNPREVAATGQSDGGDTVAALAGNTCCQDHRLKAVAVLSGAEWPPMPGTYFAGHAPPVLFVQGSADTINPPWTSVQLYRADRASPRYYLDLYGADHMVPYTGDNPVERLVARVTLAFFDRYVLGRTGALATMRQDANGSGGSAALGSGGLLPPGAG